MTPGELLVPLLDSAAWINKLLKGDLGDLTFSRHDAEEVHGQINYLRHRHLEKKEGAAEKDWTKPIEAWEFFWLRDCLDKFEHTLAAEMREAATYAVPRTGIFDTAKLVDHAEEHVPSDLRSAMNQTAVQDFHDAGRCLAFNLPTASGFHAARAVEGTLADYWRAIAGPTAAIPGNGTMGDYYVALEGFTKDSAPRVPDPKTLRTIREIEDLDRNPLMHPRESLDSNEAAILFNLTTSAIMAMARELIAIRGAAVPALIAGTGVP